MIKKTWDKFFYKGVKVRRFMKRILLITILLYSLTILFLFLGILSYVYFLIYDEFVIYNLRVLCIFISLSLVGTFFVLKYLRTRYRSFYMKIVRLQAVAKAIDSKGFVETKTAGKKIEVTYYPKFYYKQRDGEIHIRVKLDMSKHQDSFLKLGSFLETGLFADQTDYILEEGYICYSFLPDVAKTRMNINDLKFENGKLQLMTCKYWYIDTLPHMLISGGTGGGKTYFILTLIYALLSGNANLRICDPKKADLADLKTILPNVHDETNKIIQVMREFYEDMLKRSEEMKEMEGYFTGCNYADVGLPPEFLIFDEYVAFFEMLEYKQNNDVLAMMKKVAMLGRQSGYFLICAMQRPDAKYLEGGIRDQLNFRVTLGKMSPLGYSMMFAESEKVFVNKTIKGRGYCDNGKGVISEFYAPFVPKGFDFMKELGELAKKRGLKP